MGVALDDPNSDAERDPVRTAKVAVRLGEPRLNPMARQLQRGPPGNGGLFDFLRTLIGHVNDVD